MSLNEDQDSEEEQEVDLDAYVEARNNGATPLEAFTLKESEEEEK